MMITHLESPMAVAHRRGLRWALRARLDGEAPDWGPHPGTPGAQCDAYQAARVSAGLTTERPRDLCAVRHGGCR